MATVAASYLERWRMGCTRPARLRWPALPAGVALAPWRPELEERHAEATFAAFSDSLDRVLFPCFSSLDGCRGLLRELVRDRGFFSPGVWLAESAGAPVGTVQTAWEGRIGYLHNVGVAPAWRNHGIGQRLVAAALAAFRNAKLESVVLEVSAENQSAVRFYRRLGFRRLETLYRERRA